MAVDKYGDQIPDGSGGNSMYHVKVTAKVETIMRVGAPNPMQARANALGSFMQKDIGANLVKTDDGSDPFTTEVVNLADEAEKNAEKRAKALAESLAKEKEEANDLDIQEV